MKNTNHSRKGLVFIPDISGFTQLVATTSPLIGKNITYELLSTLINCNTINLEVAEIEGDAIFFFKWRALPSRFAIIKQFNSMTLQFDLKKKELEVRYNMTLDLHLKAVAHYGTMTEYFLGGFRKLYGEVVVEAHRLLKNNVPERSYLLITDELSAALTGNRVESNSNYELTSNALCEIYKDLRNICYTYMLFERPIAI